MKLHYLKKGDLYLHIQTDLFEQYDDYSDISGMVNQSYIFSEKKDSAMHFVHRDDADRYLTIHRRKLRGVTISVE